MKALILTSILLLSPSFAQAKDHASASEKSHYLFLSGKVSIAIKQEMHPITSFDGKWYQAGGKNIKPSGRLPSSLKPILAVSTMYVEVSGFNFRLQSLESEIRALHAMHEMNAEELRFQAGIDFEQGLSRANRMAASASGNTAELSSIASKQSELWQKEDELEDLTFNQTINQTTNLEELRFIDTMKGQCTVKPEKDLENVYGALSISFQFASKNGDLKKSALIRTFPVGNLKAGESHPVKFSCEFPELKIAGAKVDLFLFNSKGKHIATNMARGLKKVSLEELEQLRAQSKAQ
jgi:hypothetical protein